jgi:putative NIF3 family GTP cyclohydrolase 1 type 2
MSKRELKKYVAELNKEQLEEQLIALYDKFPAVKVYYNFVFKPNETNLHRDAKLKISNEYYPAKGRRPKMRRSVAQKFIKHFISLGVDPYIIADVMLYNMETAQSLSAKKQIVQQLFYKSMLNSFEQVVHFTIQQGIFPDFKDRIIKIEVETKNQKWENSYFFEAVLEKSITSELYIK